jgi:hypothetical protein
MVAFLANCEIDDRPVMTPISGARDLNSILSSTAVEAECEEVIMGRVDAVVADSQPSSS